MRYELMFPKDYLAAADFIEHGPKKMTIKSLAQEELKGREGQKKKKWVVKFERAKKKLVLNVTNATTIAELHGPETDHWIGKQIELFATPVQAFGKLVDAVRVRSPNGREPGQDG